MSTETYMVLLSSLGPIWTCSLATYANRFDFDVVWISRGRFAHISWRACVPALLDILVFFLKYIVRTICPIFRFINSEFIFPYIINVMHTLSFVTTYARRRRDCMLYCMSYVVHRSTSNSVLLLYIGACGLTAVSGSHMRRYMFFTIRFCLKRQGCRVVILRQNRAWNLAALLCIAVIGKGSCLTCW